MPLTPPDREPQRFLACRAERDLEALRPLLPSALQRELPERRVEVA